MERHTNVTEHTGTGAVSQANSATNIRILIVDDDRETRAELKEYLTDQGFFVDTAGSGGAMRMRMREEAYDLFIMDLMLPGEDGLALTQYIRRNSQIPVIMLTARHETNHQVIGLEVGADDYVTKPFELRELLARIKSVLRRAKSPSESGAEESPAVVKFEGRQLDLPSSCLTPSGRYPQSPRGELKGGLDTPPSVISPTSGSLTIEGLPPPDTRCSVISRKTEVAAAVRDGLISQEEARQRFELSLNEALYWQRQIENCGRNAQLTTLPKRDRRIGRLVLHLHNRTVELNGHYLRLSPKEYALLELLFSHKGEVFTREEIVSHLYSGVAAPNVKIVDVFVRSLRRKLAATTGGEHYIVDKWSRGYMLHDPDKQEPYSIPRATRPVVAPDGKLNDD